MGLLGQPQRSRLNQETIETHLLLGQAIQDTVRPYKQLSFIFPKAKRQIKKNSDEKDRAGV